MAMNINMAVIINMEKLWIWQNYEHDNEHGNEH